MREQNKAHLCTGWRIARIGEILKVRNGYAFKSSDYKSEGVPLIRQTNLGDDTVDISQAKRVDTSFLTELPGFIVREGDLLIGMSGSLGKIARYQYPEPALQNQRTGLLVVRPDADARFAKMVLKYVESQILAEGKGVAVQNVSAKEIEDCSFPLPPLDEQRRIVAEIEKQFMRLEAGVAALKRVQVNLKRYRAAVLKAACEGRLVPTEADLARKEGRAYETGDQLLARILTERRRKWQGRGKYKEPANPDTTNLQTLPEGWTWASVGQLGEIKGGKRLPMGHDYSPTPTAFPYIRVVDFENYGVRQDELKFLREETQKKIQRYTISKNDVYISIAGSIGVVGAVPDNLDGSNLTENAAKITSLSFVESKYICFWLSSNAGRSFIADKTIATTQSKLALFRIEVIPIPLPPLAEQELIVAEVERRLSVIEEQEAAVSTNLQRAARLRQSILQRAFEGHLVPVTNDEDQVI